MCIGLAEAALWRSGDSGCPTQTRPQTSHHHATGSGDIFSSIDRVDQSITECITLMESILELHRGPKTLTAVFNHHFDDLFDQLNEMSIYNPAVDNKQDSRSGLTSIRSDLLLPPEPFKSSPNRPGDAYSKSISKLEQDLDLLLQLGEGGPSTSKGNPVFDHYSNSDDEPLLGHHHTPSRATNRMGDFEYRTGL